ncbi:MAG: 6-bladed beta-propeller [Paramuribaculum sp.]|nr:6-bladed beta-propeller [Paramuribaculum sp.]
MNITRLIPLAATAAIIATSCGQKSDSSVNYTGNMPVVAQKVAVGADSVTVIDMSASEDINLIKASDLIDGLEIVKLENSDEAIVGEGAVWASDNRIIVYTEGAMKQFDRKGKYLGTVGARGQGPGEYLTVYDIDIDEKAGKIYLAEYNASKIHVYSTDGTFLNDIPLAQQARKCRIRVDNAAGKITVFAMQFTDDEGAFNAWEQDFDGNVLSKVQKPQLSVYPDFSNEIYASMATEPMEMMIFQYGTDGDSIYAYIDGDMRPVMTPKFEGKVPMHSNFSTPRFYALILYGTPEQKGEYSFVFPDATPFIVDKKTLKGSYANLILDPIGSIVVNDWLLYRNPDYFIMSLDPGTLSELIEKAPQEHEFVSKEAIERMNALKESIDVDDNNYIILGRWKK